MNISVIINSMDAGGAERVASRMINYWSKGGDNVSLFIFGNEKESFYELDSEVEFYALGLEDVTSSIIGGVERNIKRIISIRSSLKKSNTDVVISFMDKTNILVSISSIGIGFPVILSEHTDPRSHKIGWGWEVMRILSYLFSNRIVCLSKSAAEYFPYFLKQKCRVIPNPVVPKKEEIGKVPGPTEREKVICAMGRLSKTKGFDLLLYSFSKIADLHPEWTLEVWGEGEERQSLEALRQKLGLDERVRFPGLTERPFEQMKRASFFVLSSRYEGFGNVLVEALSCKLPVLSFDCPSGPREIVRPGIDGELVPPEDVDAMAQSMSRLIENPDLRTRYAERADEIRARFGLNTVMSTWDDLVQEVVRK